MCVNLKVYSKGKEKIRSLLLIVIKVDVYWKLDWDLVGSFSFNL